MAESLRIAVFSDIHYACPAEQARGADFEIRNIPSAWKRKLLRLYRDNIWSREPTGKNHLFDAALQQARGCDFAVANGDYTCNTAFVGVSDDAACQTVREVLDRLRGAFGDRFRAGLGDHELGKLSFVGGFGGMRLASWHRARNELGLPSLWRAEFGCYVFLGVVSSLVALPVYAHDALPEEMPEWERLRVEHLAEINGAFASLTSAQRVILFAHDPTALPFLLREGAVRSRVGQIEQTIIGHLHTPLVFWKARLLAGIPRVRFLGHSPHRWTSALHEARHWKPFKPRLCPSLAGCELLKDGGLYTMRLDPSGREATRFEFHPLPR